ncbi:FMN-binding protein [Lactobacillaceae bacterium Melli_B4]
MKKIIGVAISIAVAVAIIIDGYIVLFKGNQQQAQPSSGSSQSSESSSTSSSHKTTTGKYKDGTFTGKTVTTPHGVMQVSVVVSNGKMTNVKVLKYPDGEQKSEQINSQSLPTYKSEAIKAQSANIQQVSGATETYDGFKGSLQDALNQAV